MSNVYNYAGLLVWGGSVFVSWGQERVPFSFLLLKRRRACNSFDVNRLVHAHAQCRLCITSSTLQSCCLLAVMQYRNHFPLQLWSSGMWHRADWHINANVSEELASRVCFTSWTKQSHVYSFISYCLPLSVPFSYSFLAFGFFCLHLYTFFDVLI
jgi:hypothetical protein